MSSGFPFSNTAAASCGVFAFIFGIFCLINFVNSSDIRPAKYTAKPAAAATPRKAKT